MKIHARKIHRQGLSLIELLVAIALGGILMGGAISLFVNNRATYEITNDMARLQENARFALQMLSQDIRMAGYVGCINDLTKVNDNIGLSEGRLANFTHGIEGFESGATSWSPSPHIGEDGAIIAGDATATPKYHPFYPDSDGITVRFLAGDLSRTGTDRNNELINASPNDANPSNKQILIRARTFALSNGQAAAVADCGGVDLFTLAAAATASGVVANDLQRSYEISNRAIVAPLVGVRYFVRDKVYDSPDAIRIPALFRSTIDPADSTNEITVELVDGVQSMQILYGVDSDQDGLPNEFLSAGATSTVDTSISLTTRNDYLSVVAIKVSLLLGTIDEFGNALDNNVYDVGNERFCRNTTSIAIVPTPSPACTKTYPVDNRRRRVFQTTIAVRNFL